MASTVERTKDEVEESSENATGEEEDTGAQVAPVVKLQEVSVTTGEENEDALLDMKAKLYRYDNEGNQWKERGVGTVKLLKHKETGKVRLLMRQNKTLKICANHLVLPTMKIQEHAGSDKSCVWHAADYADGELKEETFCIRLASVENCRTFRNMIEEIAESQVKKTQNTEEGTSAAKLIKKLSVESKDQEEEKSESKEPASSVEEKKDDDENKEDAGEKK